MRLARRRARLRLPFASLLAVACLLLLVGCETDEPPDGAAEAPTQEPATGSADQESSGDSDGDEPDAEPSPAGSADNEKIFHGTPVERAEAMAACLEEHGIVVTPNPDDPTSFDVDPGGGGQELLFKADEECDQEIGRFTPESYPEGYVERIYEHRVWQRDCLIDLGHDLPPAPSLEEFADTMQTPEGFDPLGQISARGPEWQAAAEACPYLHQWEQQQGLLD